MAAKATQVDFLLAGLVDTNGNFLSGGKVYTYEAGSGGAVTKNTYTDSDMTTVAPNPIILDAYGRAQVFASGLYLFKVYDSNDNLLYTWDYVNYSMHNPYVTDFTNATHDHSNTANGGDLGILNDVKTKGPWADVRAYGAVGDGVTDDSEAFYQALQSGRDVYIPPGTYYIGTDLKLKMSTLGQNICGAGIEVSKIKLGTGVTGFYADTSLLEGGAVVTSKVTLKDFMIYGSGSGKGIFSDDSVMMYESRFENLRIETGDNAIYIGKCFNISFSNVHFSSETNHGIEIVRGSNTLSFYNCYARFIGQLGTQASPAPNKAGYRIHSGVFVMISCNGVNEGEVWGWFGDTANSYVCRGTIIGCNVEDFAVDGIRIEYSANFLDIKNTVFSAMSNGTYDYFIRCDTNSYFTSEMVNCQLWDNGATTTKVANFLKFYPIVRGNNNITFTATDDEINVLELPQIKGIGITPTKRGMLLENVKMGYVESYNLGGIRHTYGSSPPSSGSHAQGEIVWNTAPVAGGTVGWVCVAGGTPGTWKTFGTIAA